MKKLFLCVMMFLTPALAAQDLSGELIQGGLIKGTIEAGSKVWLDDKALYVNASGQFVFGIGRDQTAGVIKIQSPDGTISSQAINIKTRDYNIERIDGLPPSTVTMSDADYERWKVDTAAIRKARSHESALGAWKGSFILPAEGRLSGFYGSQRILNGKPRTPHYGLDVANAEGTAIKAPAAGRITLANLDFLLQGGIVIIDHGAGITSSFYHMSKIDVTEGDMVAQGQKIGEIGMSGRATGPHMDWRVYWRLVALDPELLIKK